jgi:hypothetical protein
VNYLTKLIFIPLAILSVASAKADIIIVNGDSYNEGLNDRTVVTSVGGNPGTTVGEQRLKVFEKAAEILNNSLKISAPVRVQVAFNSLYCISGSGTLGYAGPEGIEYSLADQSAIPHALYNQLIDEDIDPDTVDIYAEFNSRLDNNDNCLDNTNWHYGFDAPSGNDVSLLSIALHEIGHGLGFLSFLPGDGGMGAWWNDGFNNLTELFDPFSRQLINAETGEFLIDQNASDRRNTIRSEDNLVWNGDYVNSKANNYNEGINNGQVQIYAPSSYNDGSSISHFDIALSPNELMEPHYVEFEDHLGLALEALLDIGWSPNPDNLPNYAPVLDAIGPQTLNEDSTLSIELSASDINEDTLTFSLSDADSNLGAVLSGSTLTISPIANFSGLGSIIISVSDGENTDSEIITITVNAVNDAPVINTISQQIMQEDSSLNVNLSATDVDNENLTFSLVSAPAELGASINSNILTFVPQANYSGSENITVAVSDGDLSDETTFKLDILNVADAPVLSDISNQTLAEDTSITISLSASDVDSNSLVFALSNVSSELNAVINGSQLTITPDANYSGLGEITVSVSDGFLTDSETFSVEVSAINDAPTLVLIDDQMINEDASLQLSINASDVDTNDLSYSVASSNQAVSAVMSGNVLTVTPDANYSGAASITVTVSDGTSTASDTFIVSVDSVNDAPVLISTSAVTIEEDELFRLQLEATDIDNQLLTYTALADSSELQVTVIGSQVNIRASADHTETHSLTVVVSDGELTDTATFDIVITPVNDAPEISGFSDKEFDINEGLSLALSASDVDGDELTFSAESSDESTIAAVVSGTTLTLTATDVYNGSATISLMVSDGELTDTTTFIANITGGEVLIPLGLSVNGNPVENDDIMILSDLGDVTFAASGGDDIYDFSVHYNGSNRADLLTGSGAEKSLTLPTSGAFAGSYSLTLNDTHAKTEAFTITLQRPLRLSVDLDPILINTTTAAVSIEGAPAGTSISLDDSEVSFVDDVGASISTVNALADANTFNQTFAYINATEAGAFDIVATALGASEARSQINIVATRTLSLTITDTSGAELGNAIVTVEDERVEAWGIAATYSTTSTEISSPLAIVLPATNLNLRIAADGFNSQVVVIDDTETSREIQLVLADGYYRLKGTVAAFGFDFGSEAPDIAIELANGNTTSPDTTVFENGVLTFNWMSEIEIASPQSITLTHSGAEAQTITLDESLGTEVIEAQLLPVKVEEAPDNGDSGTDTGTDNGSGSSGGGNAAWLLITAIALLRRKRLKVKRA